MSRRIVGIDPSLTGTGLAVVTGAAASVWVGVVDPGRRRGHDRLEYIARHVSATVAHDALVVMEGPAYSQQAGQAGHHERAGLWWLITHRLWQQQIPYAVVTPTSLKRYAAGKGTASKDQVLASVIRRYGQLPGADTLDNNNAADALVLACMAADQLGAPLVGAPHTHRAALAAVTWPDVRLESVDGAR